MQTCRICSKSENLKYTANELEKLRKDAAGKLDLLGASCLLDNICFECDETRKIFHTLEDDDSSDIDVEGATLKTLDDGIRMRQAHLCKSVQEKAKAHRELRDNSLGSDGNSEIIEILSSRESSQVRSISTDSRSDVLEFIDLVTEPDCNTNSRKRKDSVELIDSEPEQELFNGFQNSEADTSLIAPISTSQESPECLQASESNRKKLSCVICSKVFSVTERLVSHMRSKHRSYNDKILQVLHRYAQDSAMTIRLRFMRNLMFYECQICGRIDSLLNKHKNHIIKQHPNACKSFRDPVYKQLECPLCKDNSSKQYLNLCRHLLSNHQPEELQLHLREISCLPGRPRKVNLTARVYQLTMCKNYFLECKLCKHVSSSYLTHSQHLKSHEEWMITAAENSPSSPSDAVKNVLPQNKTKKTDTTETKVSQNEKTIVTETPEAKKRGRKPTKLALPQIENNNEVIAATFKVPKSNANLLPQYENQATIVTETPVPKKRGREPKEIKQPQKKTKQETVTFNQTEPKAMKLKLSETKKPIVKLAEKRVYKTFKIAMPKLGIKKEVVAASLKVPKTQAQSKSHDVSENKKTVLTTKPTAITKSKDESLLKIAVRKRAEPKIDDEKPETSQRIRKNLVQQQSVTKPKYKQTKKSLLAVQNRVKIKPPVIQIPLDNYKCLICNCDFEGFFAFNFHKLQEHPDEEYNQCDKCLRAFTTKQRLDQHVCQLHKQRRKSTNRSNAVVTENNIPIADEESQPQTVNNEVNPLWLQELMYRYKQRMNNPQNNA